MSQLIFGVAAVAALTGAVVFGCGTDTPGTDAATDVKDGGTDVVESFVVGGKVSGLLGTGMVLQNNEGDSLPVSANGTFVFPTKVAVGKSFAVTVKSSPTAPSQKCEVTGGTGTVATGNVTTVVVNCTTGKFTVGGSVTGLAGSGLVLQNNAGDDITVGATGTFAFPTALTDGTDYAVTVKTQPTNLAQTCTVAAGASGKVASANVTGVSVVCVTKDFKVGGTITGLIGKGLVLQNNGGDSFTALADGKFDFSTSQKDGTDFVVTVKTDPSSPEQTCLVGGGTGKLAGGNVASVAVNCSTKAYAVGGSISGLAGAGLVLQNNGGDDLVVNANGTFAFAKPVEDLGPYLVTVKAQPTNKWQTCAVTNEMGNVAGAAVSSVQVTCTTNTYAVSGKVSGLAGAGLVLQNNAGNDLAVGADGDFEFVAPVSSGAGFVVSVLTNPKNKSQTCTVTNGTGTIAGAKITNVSVACVTNKYTVSGTITGLTAAGLALTNNGADDLVVPLGATTFTFATSIASGSAYTVAVKTQPALRFCNVNVTSGTGTVGGANVTNVAIACTNICNTVNGVRWCRDVQLTRSCNTLCTGLGYGNPTLSNAAWFAAQDTDGECQQIATAFGIAPTPLAPWTYGCAGIYQGQLYCSSYAGCPAEHRIQTEVGSYAVCPCQ
ncbi:MAG: hypothetical protein QOI41_210 [Myxococcales bacterium]|nr:hypothetical protein [Myxococcales bacterium]